MDQPNSTMASSNFTSSPGLLPHPYWYSRGLVPAVMMSFFFVLGVPGNIAVIILRPNWQRMSSLTQSLLLNLAVSDLLCLLTLPVWIHAYLNGWSFGQVACKLLEGLVYCTTFGNSLTVTWLSVQRYLVVVHRLERHHLHKILFLVLLWIFAFVLSIPTLVVRELKTHQQWTECKPEYFSDAQKVVVLMVESVFGFILLSIVVFSYLRLKRTVNQAAFFNHPQTNRLVTSIIVSLVVLWAPYLTINLVGVAGICLRNESLDKFYLSSRRIAVALIFVNSCLNPLLYAFTSHNLCTVCQEKQTLQEDERISQRLNTTTVSEL